MRSIEEYTFVERGLLMIIGTILWAIRYWYITLLLLFYFITVVIGV